MAEPSATTPRKQRAPTLYAIIAVKLLKALSLFLLALGVYALADDDLPGQFKKLAEMIRLEPGGPLFAALEARVKTITPANVLWVAAGAFLYGTLSLAEGIGLIFRIRWVGWIVITEAALLIPFEVHKLFHVFTWTVLVLFAINVLIVAYFYANRSRLFRHHHAPHHRATD